MKWFNWGKLSITWDRTPAIVLIQPIPLTSEEDLVSGIKKLNELLAIGYQITRTYQYETSIFYEMAIDSADLLKHNKKLIC